MDRDEVPFLQPPLGGFSHSQKFELPKEQSFFRKHIHNTRGINGTCRTQVLRSSADWSSNIETEVRAMSVRCVKRPRCFTNLILCF
jgi:phospholipase D1/2